ncbi:unnamed protein product [Adineta ricciae]|uniref:F-box domain-containing protein n=1 Tax=Adineta ricciae TaxID=249248 RepID=A0A814KT63_ADIRI|nr:unnamed protein product [Adineta ricciae]CAF1054028.1 unnamed protein product [Adineta ricciae]
MSKLETLPDEILREIFQYTNAADLFYSFDQLNHHFTRLVRDVPLHIEFSRVTKLIYKQFCQLILSNSQVKRNVVSLRLSNGETFSNIKDFLLANPLDSFINLRSLSLLAIDDTDVKIISFVLPSLANLSHFSFTHNEKFGYNCLISRYGLANPQAVNFTWIFPLINLRRLSTPYFYHTLTCVERTVNLTSVTISKCDVDHVLQLFAYAPLLKQLQIDRALKSEKKIEEFTSVTVNAVHLTKCSIYSCESSFKELEFLLKHTPNLRILSLRNADNIDMINAIRWQEFIEFSLKHLSSFEFVFSLFGSIDDIQAVLDIFSKFQGDFWHEQHRWYTNYQIHEYSALIYTIPYPGNDFYLYSPIDLQNSVLSNDTHIFDNVKTLSVEVDQNPRNLPHYFRNVRSLELNIFPENHQSGLTYGTFLPSIVNVSNVTHLAIYRHCKISQYLHQC